MGNSLPNAPSCVRRSEKNRQVAEEEKYPGVENEGSNEDWRFIGFLKLVVNCSKLSLTYISIDT